MPGQNPWDQKKRKDSPQGPKKQENLFHKIMDVVSPIAGIAGFHKGGTVKRTGVYRLKKGEKVLTIAQQKQYGIHKGGKRKTNSKKRVACKG